MHSNKSDVTKGKNKQCKTLTLFSESQAQTATTADNTALARGRWPVTKMLHTKVGFGGSGAKNESGED